jgi:hypothetical protein
MSPIPTVTLARLFESQEQYVEALALYYILYKKFQDTSFLEKIEEMKNEIFSSNEAEYHKLLSNIFSQEDRKRLGIFPHEQAQDYFSTLEQFKERKRTKPVTEAVEEKNTAEEKDNVKPEEPIQFEYSKILEDLNKLEAPELENISLKLFNKKINDLTISEIKELINTQTNEEETK